MNAADSHPTGDNHAPVTPMLRTLLLCDIVDSTGLVERLGDVRAVALLQRHDQLLRQLIALCHGQLVDKADGVLALFERPIQALDFALRYQRGLRELGTLEGLDLKARIGLHVGDVMTWANTPQDVLAGAKAFEVEGLAKPVAARLMNLALPGQILMSGMAQNLAQRAVGELGEAGANLRWRMHGRYSFKGVPAPMLIHEVGEPGLSPLRAPDSGNKAWRELPLWRRPPVVALEVLLLTFLGAGLFWTTLRSPPAIAFAERDWVVLADLQNRTSEPLFDDSLDTALRVGLEQSRHVNLVSQLQIDRALERMLRQGQPVDRQLATELALREGAKAVILPTVAEVGGVMRVSLEVIDPNSGVTVYSESADGRGADEVLPAMDKAMAGVRRSLGEAMTGIEQTAKPLAQVTSGNLEALKAYSMAVEARLNGRFADAQALLAEAVRLDPGFAMAHLQSAFIHYLDNDAVATRHDLDLALSHREKLSQREALFLDGAEATLSEPELALEKFKLLAALYPDDHRGPYNYAYFAHFDLLRSADGLEMLTPMLGRRHERLATMLFQAGAMQLALNRYDDAVASFERAEALGIRGYKREYVEAYAAQRRFDDASRISGLQSEIGLRGADLEARQIEVSLPLDQGRFSEALAAAARLESEGSDAGAVNSRRLVGTHLVLRSYRPDADFPADLRRYAADLLSVLPDADDLKRRHLLNQMMAAAWMAARTGDPETAGRMLEAARDEPLMDRYPILSSTRRIAEASLAMARGEPDAAIALLAKSVASDEGVYLEHATLMHAYAAGGQWGAAALAADWLASQRGRAYAEANGLGLLQPANLIESNLALAAGAEYSERLGRPEVAAELRKRFAAAWQGAEAEALAAARRPAG